MLKFQIFLENAISNFHAFMFSTLNIDEKSMSMSSNEH